MRYIDKLRRMERHKLVIRGLLLIVLIYSVISAALVFSLSVIIFDTIESRRLVIISFVFFISIFSPLLVLDKDERLRVEEIPRSYFTYINIIIYYFFTLRLK